MWTCDSCGEDNADGANVCDVCDRPRTSPAGGFAGTRRAPIQPAIAVYPVSSPPPPPRPEPGAPPQQPHAAWPDTDGRPPRTPGRRQVWAVALAAVFTAALALTAVLVLPRMLSSDDSHAAATPTPPPGTASPLAADPPESTDAPTPTSADTYVEPTPTPSETIESTEGIVHIDPSVGDTRAADIAAMFETYFGGINDKDYDVVATVLDPSGSINPNDAREMSAFAKGTRSTHDSDVTLNAISDLSGSRMLADVTFESRQKAGDGPRGRASETCTRWDIAYTVSSTSGQYKIVKGKASSRPC